ncbi:MAG TPA: FUSC family protein, partial [Candidatus Eisenbacteria bacterium]|nr:FUSC family protein [Candidatus Eisenbacteria bacterium]
MIRRALAGFALGVAVVAWGLGAAVAAPAKGPAGGPGGPVRATAPPPIEWRAWSREAFDEAKTKNK